MPRRTRPTPVTDALTEALADAPTLPRDAAAVALAKLYADQLDAGDPEALDAIGPKLLTVLNALGMTPAGRGVKGGAAGVDPGKTKLDELRERRRRKTGDASG